MTVARCRSAVFAAMLLAASARADVTVTDLQVAARALSFMSTPLSGDVKVGILYSPSSPGSMQDAQELLRLMGNGLRAGSLDLHGTLVDIKDAATARVDLFFLTDYVGEEAASALDGANAKRPCVTRDLEQVERGTCLMGVRSTPKVQIVVNRAAADRSGITFATVFRVMITEI